MSVEVCYDNHKIEILETCKTNDSSNNLDQALRKIIEKEGLNKCVIDKISISTNGGNYLGVLYEINIKGITQAGVKNLHLFVKKILPGEENMKIFTVPDLYDTELFVYKDLSKVFNELQDEYEVPVQERYKMVKCYDESYDGTLIMENLTKKGFTTYHRMDLVSLHFAEEAIKTLARFHSLSFVLKEKRPAYFQKNIQNVKYPFKMTSEDWSEYIKDITNISRANLDEDLKKKVEKAYASIEAKNYKYFTDEATQRCLCHGDYKPNNILTRFENGEATELVPVDFQLLFYGCPLLDFFFFIFSCTDRQFRKKHMVHLKDLYYKTLNDFLKYFDIDSDLVFPRREFEEMYKSRMDYGIVFAVLFLPYTLVPDDDVPDITKGVNFKLDKKYNDRLRDIVEDLIEWGLI